MDEFSQVIPMSEQIKAMDNRHEFMRLVNAMRVLSDNQVMAIRCASEDDLADAMITARALNKGR